MNLTVFTRTASCFSAGTLLALAGAAHAQSAPPAPPTAPSTPIHSVTSVTSSWSMTQSNDGRSITVNSKDGKLSAEIDGKAVPEDRISQKGNTVTVKDDAGNIVFDSPVPGFESSSRNSPFTATAAPRGWARSGRGGSLALGDPDTLRVATDAPKVMAGVQLLEPDSSLRGHLGLKENESTLIGATYEGLPAAQAGLEPYDIIVGIGGKDSASPQAVRKALRETEAGKSISLNVLHRGQKKIINVTVEKYDAEKLERAKVNAIAAASTAPNALSGSPFASAFSGNGNPMVATIPGQPGQPGRSITLFGTADNEEMSKRMEEIIAKAHADAERSQDQARQLQERLNHLNGFGGPNMMDLNKVMEERMRKMEEMMQKMMERQSTIPAPTIKKDENKS